MYICKMFDWLKVVRSRKAVYQMVILLRLSQYHRDRRHEGMFTGVFSV